MKLQAGGLKIICFVVLTLMKFVSAQGFDPQVNPDKIFSKQTEKLPLDDNTDSTLSAMFEQQLLFYQSLDTVFLKSQIKYPGFINRPGDSNQYIIPIKKRLAQLKLYNGKVSSMKFDHDLDSALRRFQLMHALKVDGLPGPKTYEKLAWNPSDYLHVLKINYKKYQLLPDNLPPNRIVVNIPSYTLKLYLQDSLAFLTTVIVGKYKTPTPVLQSEIDYLVFNPCWTLPHNIAVKYVLPGLQQDSAYLKKRNMFLTLKGKTVASNTFCFSEYSKNNFPFKVYQNAGAENALGKVKFMFQNNYHVYLHDTPDKHLFNQQNKSRSNGCIRVKNAMKLAQKLYYNLDHQKKSMQSYLNPGYPVKYFLKTKPTLFITYFTVGYSPHLHSFIFYTDIYKQN